ncbi:MAG: adenosylcobinamide-phosphate synthase CbiB [Alicyclobacillaceae bacterium]|nr:adenosylcobinamide-phosphate synthase CbiB [Alicyclobacillaceae bacterium]
MIAVLGGLLLDLGLGEPPGKVHPVVGIGRMIHLGEKGLRRLFAVPVPEGDGGPAPARGSSRTGGPPSDTGTGTGASGAGSGGEPGMADVLRAGRERAAGAVLAVGVVGAVGALTWATVWAAGCVHPAFGAAVSAAWTWIAVAPRSLAEAGRKVAEPLRRGDLPAARRAAGMIVSRCTEDLPEEEIVRAAVESISENIVDAVVAPLLYAFFGGGPAAMAYRAANTLDAMVGYRNRRYRDFGWASARLDDVLNWIPARLTAVLLTAAAGMLGYDARGACRAVRKDARRHPSPNGGWPEAAVAGALGIRLGGWNVYHGRRSFRPYLGRAKRPLEVGDIGRAAELMAWTTAELSLLMLAVGGGLGWW